MLMDNIFTWKNGSWQRAIFYNWNGTVWEVSEVFSTGEGTYNKNNLNATAKVRTYIPTWWTSFEMTNGGMVNATNGAGNSGIFNVGAYPNYDPMYRTAFGMPYSSIIADYQDTFGIALIKVTYQIQSIGSQGFGRTDIYGIDNINKIQSGGSYSEVLHSLDYTGYDLYIGTTFFNTSNLTEDTESTAWDGVFMNIARGNCKGFVFSGDEYTSSVWFTASNLQFEITWAGK